LFFSDYLNIAGILFDSVEKNNKLNSQTKLEFILFNKEKLMIRCNEFKLQQESVEIFKSLIFALDLCFVLKELGKISLKIY